MSTLLELPLNATGTFEVRTESGTDYVLNLGQGMDTIVRRPGLHKPSHGGTDVRLVGDFEPLPLLGLSDVAVHHRASFSAAVGDEVVMFSTTTIEAIDER